LSLRSKASARSLLILLRNLSPLLHSLAVIVKNTMEIVAYLNSFKRRGPLIPSTR
jgi:hypothetical protein